MQKNTSVHAVLTKAISRLRRVPHALTSVPINRLARAGQAITRAALFPALLLLAGTVAQGQPYSNAVMSLGPAAYWPLSETTQPPFGSYVATNLGSAGAVAPGYYESWYQTSGSTFYETNHIVHVAGPIGGGSPDQALVCGNANGQGQYLAVPRTTNGVFNPATTIQAPFTVELWAMTTNLTAGLRPMVTQGRSSVMGDASVGYNNVFAGFGLGQFQGFFYFQLYCTNANANGGPELDMKGITVSNWYHIAVSFDGTTETMYSNGVYVTSATATLNAAGLRYVPDLVNPLIIGSGNAAPTGSGGTEWSGFLGEVAIYPTALSQPQIANHYAAASTSDNYAAAVQADGPTYFFRMNEPPMTSYPSPTSYPTATNYGAMGAVANGLYQPGTTPGVAGPSYSGFGGSSRAVAFNGLYGGVDIGNGSLNANLNPTNHQPVSVAAWFRANPVDSRFQEIASHGDAGWRLAFNGNNGSSSTAPWDTHWNPGNGPELGGVNLADVLTNGFMVNDGNWHMAVGVSDGTTNGLYVDGALFKTGTAVGNITGSTLDALIGGSPNHTVPTYNGGAANIRYFDGEIAHVAFWTNSLTAAQVSQLYGAAGVAPSIIQGPPSSMTVNAGTFVSIPVLVHGSAPLSYQWYKIGSGAVGGQTTASLTFNPVALGNAGTYYVVVTNTSGTATSSQVALTVNGPPVVQQQSPTNIRVFAGTAPVLRATVTGPSPISYQWLSNGVAISGATSSNYVPRTATIATSTYSCSITNLYSTNTPSAFSPITVAVLADPSASYPTAVLSDHPISFYRLDEGPDNGSGNNGVTAYDYAGGLNGSYSNTVLAANGYDSNFSPQTEPSETAATFSNGSGMIDSYAGNVSSYMNFATPAGSSAAFSVETWVNDNVLLPSTDAGVVTLGYGFGGEQFNLDTGAHLPDTSRTLRFYINDSSNRTWTASATVRTLDANWHHVVGVCDQPNGRLSLYVDGQINSSTAIPTGAGIRSFTTPLSIGSRMSNSGATDYDNQFAGTIDEVAIYNTALTASRVVAHYAAAGVPPILTLQPSNTVADEGTTAQLFSSAIGTTPLAYQWYDTSTGPLAGQTSATLTINNVPSSDDGHYFYVTVTNLYGSATSTNALLSVPAGPPSIQTDLQPLMASNYVGTPFGYTIYVTGTAPFTYVWTRNGSTISGATNSSYSFSTLPGTNKYAVTIKNSVNPSGATSSTATNVGVARPTLNPGDYTYHMKVTFSGYNRGETLADFPALVNLGTNLAGFAYSQFASPTGGDLRFTDSTGTNEIPHEIDEWNTTNTSPVWVQVPRLSSTNDYVWAYWGNPSATTPPAYATNGSVWLPASFEGLPAYNIVYHLKEGALPFADSTQQHPAINGTAPTATPGVVGTAGGFTGSNWLDAGTNDLDSAFTLSTWVNIPNGTSDIQTLWANQHGGFGAPGFAFFVNTYHNSDQKLDFASGDGTAGNEATSAAATVGFGAWHQVVAAVNRTNGTVTYYVDGASLATLTTVVQDFTTLQDLNLGRFLDGNFGLHGGMDEARIQQGNPSANWVWADYMTAGQNSAFETYGTVISSIVTITAQEIPGGKVVVTWPSGTLLEAASLAGPWSTNNAASPYTNTISGPQHYFRVRVR
ncbi:MAG: hypothetical protein C5B50_13470 [Verrucomicrobia bacterium]|nr:MAG: hypothetical protein C5B50_13470 [Verrucomicrobiota bacterium]